MIGRTLGSYQIVAKLGEGGMGEVYRAHDAKLGRDIAIKLLPAHLESDASAATRFEREARAVAALNHPNIVTIYGIDEADGRSFIAMELVDGVTLRDLVPAGGLSIDEVLKHAIPLADALATAHEAGIVHRDLKPANVMLTKDGRIKVLDFGLAKLREDATELAETRTGDLTGQGQVVGTVSYMSPEQASGGELDARSDLFAVGVLLYEMSTGQRPFTGKSSVDVLAAILKDTPASVTDLRADLPRDFNRIIRRALAKDPEDRYQTAKDLRNDLKTLKADLTSGELSASVVRGVPQRSGRWLAAFGAAAVVVIGGLGYWIWDGVPATPLAVEMTPERLTSTERASLAAITPDGRYVVHVVSGDQQSLWVRQVATTSDVQIVAPGPEPFIAVAIEPAGDFVYFTRATDGVTFGLFRVPILGGAPPRLVIDDVDSAVAFSPDGARMAFVRGVPAAQERRAIVAASDGTGEHVIATSPLDGQDALANRIAWAPHGRSLALARGGRTPMGSSDLARVTLLDVEAGTERDVTVGRWDVISGMAWLSDDSLVISAAEPSKRNLQLWSVGLNGTTQRLTRDLSSYSGVTTSADGDTIATVMVEEPSTLSVTGVGGALPLTPVTSGPDRHDGRFGLTWTHGGSLIYGADNDQVNLWAIEVDGSNARPLTSDDVVESSPIIAPDDSYLIHTGEDQRPVRLDLASGRSTALPFEPTDVVRYISPDGSLLVSRPDGWYRAAPNASNAVLTVADGMHGVVSPDGRFIAGVTNRLSRRYQIGVFPTDGTEPTMSFDIASLPFLLAWTPSGEALTFLERRKGPPALWSQPLAGGDPTLLFDLGGEQIYDFAWSDDGRLAVAHGPTRSDVVLFRGVR